MSSCNCRVETDAVHVWSKSACAHTFEQFGLFFICDQTNPKKSAVSPSAFSFVIRFSASKRFSYPTKLERSWKHNDVAHAFGPSSQIDRQFETYEYCRHNESNRCKTRRDGGLMRTRMKDAFEADKAKLVTYRAKVARHR